MSREMGFFPGKGRQKMKKQNPPKYSKSNDDIEEIYIQSLFSRNLKRLRNYRNMSQMELASAAGLAMNFISNIENGKKWVSAKTIAKLAIALKADPYQFFISDSSWDSQGEQLFSIYLDDLSDSFEKMVNEYRDRYLGGKGGKYEN
jgi:transcriptional regulator with XRE-family HTH domain